MVDMSLHKILTGLTDIDVTQDQFEWEAFKEGIEISRIHDDKNEGPAAALLRYSAGAEAPMHLHVGYEHILILSGSQSDGVNVFSKGMLIISTPGSLHRIYSESGCIALAIWQSPVKFIEESE